MNSSDHDNTNKKEKINATYKLKEGGVQTNMVVIEGDRTNK
jgi:hypothetical protein